MVNLKDLVFDVSSNELALLVVEGRAVQTQQRMLLQLLHNILVPLRLLLPKRGHLFSDACESIQALPPYFTNPSLPLLEGANRSLNS